MGSRKKDSIASCKSDPLGNKPVYDSKKSNFGSPTSKVHTVFSRNDGEGVDPLTIAIKSIPQKKVLRTNSNHHLSRSVFNYQQTDSNNNLDDLSGYQGSLNISKIQINQGDTKRKGSDSLKPDKNRNFNSNNITNKKQTISQLLKSSKMKVIVTPSSKDSEFLTPDENQGG
jgi:hypothetical protein